MLKQVLMLYFQAIILLELNQLLFGNPFLCKKIHVFFFLLEPVKHQKVTGGLSLAFFRMLLPSAVGPSQSITGTCG